jgi:hypothetical protein
MAGKAIQPTDALAVDAVGRENPFEFIKPDELDQMGIDTADIPPGTFAARKHPARLPSRFGGNAYGFGFFEIYNQLGTREIRLLHAVDPANPARTKQSYKEINRIYRKLGLLIRLSRHGNPYFLIPANLVSNSLSYVRHKADEISKIIHFHRRKYLKESYRIGLLTYADDLIVNELTVRFREHQFAIIDSLARLLTMSEPPFDLVVIPADIYGVIRTERFNPRWRERPSPKKLEDYALYVLGKIYRALKPDGEVFIIANHYASETNQTVNVAFRSTREEKDFALFSHIFKTKKKYRLKRRHLQVNVFDFQRYLSGLYVEQDVLEGLLGGRRIEDLTLREIDQLHYLNFSLDVEPTYDQERGWSKILSVYFEQIFLKPLVPESTREDWNRRFSTEEYAPRYMLIYLGQRRPPHTTLAQLKTDIVDSRLAGCPLSLAAEYRDSFDFLIRTLEVLKRVKDGSYEGLPKVFMERLKRPFETKQGRYRGLNDVVKLISRLPRLKRIRNHLNPELIEGSETRILSQLETLPLFGLSYGELREILLTVVGHTAMGRILSGKMNERVLRPVTDLARSLDPLEALNLLRYCRLMSMAQRVASLRSEVSRGESAELFRIYESMVRIVTNKDLDWDQLLDEKMSTTGGIHNKIVRNILQMMGHFQFLDNWSELKGKGAMEKEALADYDEAEFCRIENVIRLVEIITEFERRFLLADPLQLPIFYRKFLNMEFHGTGRIFKVMDSRLAYILLWVTVNVARGDVINFNPLLAKTESSAVDAQVRKIEAETKAINTDSLDLATLKELSKQLYESDTTFIVGTGFQLRVNHETQAVDIDYINMDEDIDRLKHLVTRFRGCKISKIPAEEIENLESLFGKLESFYQSHLRLPTQQGLELRLPERQRKWFLEVRELREKLRSNLLEVIFFPEDVYNDLDLLYHHTGALLHFVLPEFMALQDLRLTGKLYLKTPLIEHTLKSTRMVQALIRGEREGFQDIQILRKLAQREFGPMDAGVLGLTESQLDILADLLHNLSDDRSLFDAVIKSFIFRDIGLVPAFCEKYMDEINQADHAQAGAVFLKNEQIAQRYHMDPKAEHYLILLVEHHDIVHHIIRGEFSIWALQELVDFQSKDLFDAVFVSSFIMFSAMKEDLILEDLANQLFDLRTLCHGIIDEETTLKAHLNGIFRKRGQLSLALDAYRQEGLPGDMTPIRYLESWKSSEREAEGFVESGKMVYALERLFRLRGIRYVEFVDLASLLVNVPLKFIYKRKNYRGIGYSTFEKELFEALRIYNALQRVAPATRYFILERLVTDEVRIFGFENVIAYLNYENMITLLLIALRAAQRFKQDQRPVWLDFLHMAQAIEKRYEAVNHVLSQVAIEDVRGGGPEVSHYFKAKAGIVVRKDERQRVLSIDFVDRINITQKIAHMKGITELGQLKNYYHYSLKSLRKSPFYTDDYERELERAFDERFRQITDLMLEQTKNQMELLKDLRDIHKLVVDLTERAFDIGFSDDQRYRLNDIYEVRKDSLKREKLMEINGLLETISDPHELKDYWESVKWYLRDNRPFLGKEFENLIAVKFDETTAKLEVS